MDKEEELRIKQHPNDHDYRWSIHVGGQLSNAEEEGFDISCNYYDNAIAADAAYHAVKLLSKIPDDVRYIGVRLNHEIRPWKMGPWDVTRIKERYL